MSIESHQENILPLSRVLILITRIDKHVRQEDGSARWQVVTQAVQRLRVEWRISGLLWVELRWVTVWSSQTVFKTDVLVKELFLFNRFHMHFMGLNLIFNLMSSRSSASPRKLQFSQLFRHMSNYNCQNIWYFLKNPYISTICITSTL